MSFWQSLAGTQVIRLASADPTSALRAFQNANVTLLDVTMVDELTWQFVVSRKDGKIVRKLAEKRGDRYLLVKQNGYYWSIVYLYKRPVLVVGMLLMVLFSWWLSGRVLFVRVEGNIQLSDRLIIEEASKCGIYFGASVKDVGSQQIKNNLLSNIPQLQWAGVRIQGCVAVISVQEGAVTQPKEPVYDVSSIVAAKDAVIDSITVLRGNALCKAGQAVKAGQVLISGYTDCGICIQATAASGEILGHTSYALEVIFPVTRQVRQSITNQQRKFSIIIGKKQINLSKYSGISGGSCAKIYEQNFISLPGGFTLPISFLRETWIYYDTLPGIDPDGEVTLKAFAQDYVLQQTNAGKFESALEFVTTTDQICKLDGRYGCLENIGIVRVEENINNYGKDN